MQVGSTHLIIDASSHEAVVVQPYRHSCLSWRPLLWLLLLLLGESSSGREMAQ